MSEGAVNKASLGQDNRAVKQMLRVIQRRSSGAVDWGENADRWWGSARGSCPPRHASGLAAGLWEACSQADLLPPFSANPWLQSPASPLP